MARLLTQKDVYAIINAMVSDMTGGQSSLRAVDTSSFISCGELVMSYPTENILNSLGLLMGRILFSARPYKGKWDIINTISTGAYTHRLAKVSVYNRPAVAAGPWNTDLYTNMAEGFTNGQNKDANDDPQSVKSMWEMRLSYPVELNFGGSSVWDTCITIPEIQLNQAFRDPGELNELISTCLVEHENDIELEKQAFRNAIVLNHIAGVYDLFTSGVMPGSVVNLTEAFNVKYYGSDTTSYKTSAELRSTYLKEFLAFMVATIKTYSKRLANKSANYHWTPEKVVNGETLELLRHTPRDKQKLFMYEPLFIDAESMVMSEVFNPKYLDIGNYEGVEFWQNENAPESIEVTPAIPDTNTNSATYGTQIAGTKVTLDYVVGLMFDTDALMSDFQVERVDSTPLEARKLYRNLWFHAAKNGINDFTEKSILFIMADPTI